MDLLAVTKPKFWDLLSQNVGGVGQGLLDALMAPGNALAGQYDQYYDPSNGQTTYGRNGNPYAMMGDASNLSGMVMTGGMPLPKPEGSLGIVGGNMAKAIKMETALPNDPIFAEAVRGTKGAEITPDGLKINISRFQPAAQHGTEAIRTGTFYLPEGSANAKYYRTGKSNYGGGDNITGETVIRKPLFVKGATGGKAPEAAYAQLKGKAALEQLDRDVFSAINQRGLNRIDPGIWEQEIIPNLLKKYGADPGLASEIIRNSTKGNQLRYALQENIIAHAIRDAGYDAMVGYSKGKAGPFISEVFDVREHVNPVPGMMADQVHPAFKIDM